MDELLEIFNKSIVSCSIYLYVAVDKKLNEITMKTPHNPDNSFNFSSSSVKLLLKQHEY